MAVDEPDAPSRRSLRGLNAHPPIAAGRICRGLQAAGPADDVHRPVDRNGRFDHARSRPRDGRGSRASLHLWNGARAFDHPFDRNLHVGNLCRLFYGHPVSDSRRTDGRAAAVGGHAMTQRGDAAKALGWALVGGLTGGVFSTAVMTTLATPLSNFALGFGAPGYFAAV